MDKKLQNINFGKSKRPQESSHSNSNVNSAILDSIENTTLVHTNQMSRKYIHLYKILNAKNAILGLKKFEMRLRGFRGSTIPVKCVKSKQCHFKFNCK